MANPINERYEALRPPFQAAGQGHVFAFWPELTSDQKRQLLDDLGRINLKQLADLRRIVLNADASPAAPTDLAPATVIPRESVSREIIERGRALLAAGKVAVLTVAGGQGTRLGFDGPKGAFPISPVANKTLFQLFAESILATGRRYGSPITWYIMTSPENARATRSFFESHSFFGLSQEQVRFFPQGVMPSFDPMGRIRLSDKHRLALSPDGHGGSLLAMASTGTLADMATKGIEQISYTQVDNPLVACLDPVFIGLHDAHGSDMSSKTLPKADDLERVGNFALVGDRLTVIEYSDLSEELAHAKNEDGSRRFDAASVAIHILSRSFVERLTAQGSGFALPWHVAKKKVPCVNLDTGELTDPAAPNAVKLEVFVFDALSMAKNPILVGTSRAEEFSPVKNKTGVDSVDTARRDLSRRAAWWLERAGMKIPRDAQGEPTASYEISPLVALDAEELAARAAAGGLLPSEPPAAGEGFCLDT